MKITELTDRLNSDTSHSNQESREHLGEKEYKLYFLKTGIVLEQAGRSVRNRTGCWIFVRRLPGNKDYSDQFLDLLLTREPM